jgi:hypothetical protein
LLAGGDHDTVADAFPGCAEGVTSAVAAPNSVWNIVGTPFTRVLIA